MNLQPQKTLIGIIMSNFNHELPQCLNLEMISVTGQYKLVMTGTKTWNIFLL